MVAKSLRVLSLHTKQNGTETLYRLKQGMILQFRLGPSLLGCKIELFTNYPADKSTDFDRSKFRPLDWSLESNNVNDNTAFFCNIELDRAGSFRFYFTCPTEDIGGEGYFLVDPELRIGTSQTPLPFDCLQMQTVLAKNLGPLSTWESKLQVAKECGYNMIHFTPVSVLGGSNSAYSLADQHNLNDTFKCSWNDLDGFIRKLENEWNILSICDIVLNHTANETKWLSEQPEATYNCKNCPHLRPAFILDRIIHRLSLDIEKGLWVERGIPKGEVSKEEHLGIIRSLLYDHYFPQMNIFEYFLMDTADILQEFEKMILNSDPPSPEDFPPVTADQLKIIPDPQYRRLKATVDLNLAMKLFNVHRSECGTEEHRILVCCSELKKSLDKLNHATYNRVWNHLNAAVENVIAGARYHRVQEDGPRTKYCGRSEPLVCQYFTGPDGDNTVEEEEKMMYSDRGALFMAHNGWVMNADPLQNFAAPGSNVYLRRELVAWGDSVKLRFGDRPEDSPFLWKYFKEYAEQTARVFHGIRLDNCHSTPIHVAEYMLDAARRIRPDLYVIAELFTSSEGHDNVFINRLGISSLIREAQSAWDSHELGRLVHRFGGEPVGSFIQPLKRPLVPSMAHAILFDQTHDNPSALDKRSVHDILATAGLVSMSSCALGSTRGYDEVVPHHIHVVNERRQYQEWGKHVNEKTGLIQARRALNKLHKFLGENNYSEVYVDQMDYDIVAVTRHCADTHESFVIVSHTVFSKETDPNRLKHVKPVCVEGRLMEIVLEAKVVVSNDKEKFVQDNAYINGMKSVTVELSEGIQIDQSKMARQAHSGEENMTKIELHNFPPGSVIVFRFELQENHRTAAEAIRKLLKSMGGPSCSLMTIANKLSLLDIQHALFKCDQEEWAAYGGGVYTLDGYGALKYAGLQGIMSILSEIRPKNDLGNWLPGNLRHGNWLMDYIVQRLCRNSNTKSLGEWLLLEGFEPIKRIPRYLIPRYFDAVITQTYVTLLKRAWSLMSPFIQRGSHFTKALALGSVQHTGIVPNAPLPDLSPSLAPPVPGRDGDVQLAPTLAAGLPHFSVGYMRSWGRDTFIALRGLLILTGRFNEARYIILGYAGCLRHGLIPNLLDGGRNARYNCRDATWWWLHCIKSYTEEAPEGYKILNDKVSRLYPNDDSDWTSPGKCDQSLAEVIQEALQKHFQGLKFRERNAGTKIDEHMTDLGFNNEIGVDLETGFVYGGNVHNCGTWMDKMGSSVKANNKGKPATPRDGSAVEIVGLSYASLKALAKLNAEGHYPFNSVERTLEDGQKVTWTIQQWADKIRENFDRHYYVTHGSQTDKHPELINKVGIYKDTLNSGQAWADYQLRCNFPIAMAVAPELFAADKAWQALQIVKDNLLGPLGIATLDPDDWAYRGNYDNSNDSNDFTVAHGFNYHQGPEWVWPVGFFLRAYLHFAKAAEGENGYVVAKNFSNAVLSAHFVEVQNSHWKGIPELTNAKGSFCPGSNPIQAWSMSCLLEVLYELEQNS